MFRTILGLVIANALTAYIAITNNWDPAHAILLSFVQMGVIGFLCATLLYYKALRGFVIAAPGARLVTRGQYAMRAIFMLVIFEIILFIMGSELVTHMSAAAFATLPAAQFVLAVIILSAQTIVEMFRTGVNQPVPADEYTKQSLMIYARIFPVMLVAVAFSFMYGAWLLAAFFVIKTIADAIGLWYSADNKKVLI